MPELAMDAPLSAFLAARRTVPIDRKQPFVSLSYAQSIDGSITFRRGVPFPISCEASMTLTHMLRASHDGILVGIGTVLADNPQLNVRLVEGNDPQPIILDSHLRTPPQCRLIRGPKPPWIATTENSSHKNAPILRNAGARLLSYPRGTQDQVPLEALLTDLFHEGIKSLMVEGGAAVIHSFIASGFVDWIMVTIAPQFLAGLPALTSATNHSLDHPIQLEDPSWAQFGEDMVVWGKPKRVSL